MGRGGGGIVIAGMDESGGLSRRSHCLRVGSFPDLDSDPLAQASRGGVDRFADGFAGDEEFDSAVLLAA